MPGGRMTPIESGKRVKPSDWLMSCKPDYLYRESRLEKLEMCDIGYADGMLTSHMQYDRPYITFGRMASVDLLTPREAIAQGARLKRDGREEPLVWGWAISESLWRLLHPLIESGPPSLYVEDTTSKMLRNHAALVRFGY